MSLMSQLLPSHTEVDNRQALPNHGGLVYLLILTNLPDEKNIDNLWQDQVIP